MTLRNILYFAWKSIKNYSRDSSTTVNVRGGSITFCIFLFIFFKESVFLKILYWSGFSIKQKALPDLIFEFFTEKNELYPSLYALLFNKNNCKVLICNYFKSRSNNFLRNFATQRNLPFCDNEQLFQDYKEKHGAPSAPSLISEDDWHPSFKGYSLIANNIQYAKKTMIKPIKAWVILSLACLTLLGSPPEVINLNPEITR